MANVGSDVNNYSKTELCVMVIFPKLVNPCQGIFWDIETLHKSVPVLTTLSYNIFPFYPLQAPRWTNSILMWSCVEKLIYVCKLLFTRLVHLYHGICWAIETQPRSVSLLLILQHSPIPPPSDQKWPMTDDRSNENNYSKTKLCEMVTPQSLLIYTIIYDETKCFYTNNIVQKLFAILQYIDG